MFNYLHFKCRIATSQHRVTEFDIPIVTSSHVSYCCGNYFWTAACSLSPNLGFITDCQPGPDEEAGDGNYLKTEILATLGDILKLDLFRKIFQLVFNVEKLCSGFRL